MKLLTNIFILNIILGNVFADKINSVTIAFPTSACDELVNNGTGSDVQTSNGVYTLTNYYNYSTSVIYDPSYTCYTYNGETSKSVAISALSGTFAYIDPNSWFGSKVWGGVGFSVNGAYTVPCSGDMNIAYASAPYTWCSNMSDYGHSGGSKGFNDWYVNSPNITLSKDWQSMQLLLEEWGEKHSWDNPWHNIWLSVSHAYKDPPTPSPDLSSTILYIAPLDSPFSLYDENGKNIDQAMSPSSSGNRFYRVGQKNKRSTFYPYFGIGMSLDSMQQLQNANYICRLTMSSPQGQPLTVGFKEMTFRPAQFPGYAFYFNETPQVVYTPQNNIVTIALNTKCTNTNKLLPEIDFKPQTLEFYIVKHF